MAASAMPGRAYWLLVLVVAPLLAVTVFVLIGYVVPDFEPDGNDPLVVLVLLATALGALAPRALPHVRAMPLTVRRGWALAGALVAGISVLPWAFLLLFAAFALFCEGECLS